MLLELLPFVGGGIDVHLKQTTLEYANEFLYNDKYRNCYIGKTVMFFDEPVSCVDRDYTTFIMGKLGFAPDGMVMIDDVHVRTEMVRDDGVRFDVVSTANTGAVLAMSLKMPSDLVDGDFFARSVELIEAHFGSFSGSQHGSFMVESNLDFHVTETADYVEYAYVKRDAYKYLTE